MKTISYLTISVIFWILIIWLGGLCWFGYHINHYPLDLATKTDAIVVLTGGRHRIEEGLKLLNKNLAQRMLISGVSRDVSIKDIEKQSGIKATDISKIELGYSATNTVENAAEIGEWIKRNKIHSVRFVTSNYHIPRGLEELSVYNIPVQVVIHPVYSEKVSEKWWQTLGSLKLIFWEYNKFIYTWLTHRLKRWVVQK
jgi:uncharacterized SAM-binding protein YcdF (DUF218 family)